MSFPFKRLRIGTWNLGGKVFQGQDEVLRFLDCDVVLLQEVPPGFVCQGTRVSCDEAANSAGNHWAGVATSLEIEASPGRAPAEGSWAVEVDGLTFVSSVLPYRSSPSSWPLPGQTQEERTELLLAHLDQELHGRKLVWGGDWNHALVGPDHAGSQGGRELILSQLERWRLQVPGLGLAQHTKSDLPPERTIDHVAVPDSWKVVGVERHVAELDGRRVSDHDAYVVEVLTSGVYATSRQ